MGSGAPFGHLHGVRDGTPRLSFCCWVRDSAPHSSFLHRECDRAPRLVFAAGAPGIPSHSGRGEAAWTDSAASNPEGEGSSTNLYDFRGPRGSGRHFAPSRQYKEGEPRWKRREERKELEKREETTEPKEPCIDGRTTGSPAESRSCRVEARRDSRLCQWRRRYPANFSAMLQEKRGHSRCVPLAGKGKAMVVGRRLRDRSRKANSGRRRVEEREISIRTTQEGERRNRKRAGNTKTTVRKQDNTERKAGRERDQTKAARKYKQSGKEEVQNRITRRLEKRERGYRGVTQK
ncbi:hypothetical protein NDU88_007275 [Pleurodeles waltl]|uniref:Uncharacterized protein n=1 Tax=Pleurodeles waltl TaxID=8319 RepID=A0AAV7TZB8_PLEWA|nr:hypothetical protein NDU88_007275 [Pleurodeles waltl]